MLKLQLNYFGGAIIKKKLLENGLYVKVPIKTTNIEITENNINIFYTIIDNNIEYELKIQLEDE